MHPSLTAPLLLCTSLVSLASADVTGSTGNSAPIENRQPSLAITFGIRTDGAYAGQIGMFASQYVPTGWTKADGKLLSTTTSSVLFNAIGTIYGGNGQNNFRIPDLRGRAVVGSGVGSGLSGYTIGQTGGAESITLTESQLPAHVHSVSGGTFTGVTGGNQPIDTRQPTLAMNYLINTNGFYPPRQALSPADLNTPYYSEMAITARSSVSTSTQLLAGGQLLPIAQNTALFSLLGTTFGGNGTTTFAVPDMRGRIGSGAGFNSFASRTIGEDYGFEQTTLVTSQLPAHSHTIPGGGSTGNAGSGQPIDNAQPSLTLNYYIETQGIFPSQNLSDTATENNPSASANIHYLGEIDLFANNFVPQDYALCDGSILSIAQNPNLFLLLGTTYGGNGTTTFALPDLRGITPIGAGQGTGLSNYTLGQQVGALTNTLTLAQLAAHTHAVPEPSTLGVMSAGLLFAARRRRA